MSPLMVFLVSLGCKLPLTESALKLSFALMDFQVVDQATFVLEYLGTVPVWALVALWFTNKIILLFLFFFNLAIFILTLW